VAIASSTSVDGPSTRNVVSIRRPIPGPGPGCQV
jgi:hypothetical protein